LRQVDGLLARLVESVMDGSSEGLLGSGVERNEVAAASADLAEGGDVGTDDAAASEKSFRHGKAEAFDEGRNGEEITVAIAPLQLFFGDAVEQDDAVFDRYGGYEAEDLFGFGARDTDEDQTSVRGNLLRAKEALEDAQKEEDVFVGSMLCHTQQEWLSVPVWKGGERRRDGIGLDAVGDDDRLAQGDAWIDVLEPRKRTGGDACDGIDCRQTLAQDELVEQHAGKAEVFRDVVGIEVVQGNDGGAVKGVITKGNGIGEMDDVCAKLLGEFGKLPVIPEVATESAGTDRSGMKMQTSIASIAEGDGFAKEILLPRGGDEMNGGNLTAREQAASEIDSMALHAGDLVRERCEGDDDVHVRASSPTGFGVAAEKRRLDRL
jgi:hypothetical protein